MSQPSLLTDKDFSDTFEPSHLVDKSLHDDDCHHREQLFVIFDAVYFKDNEAFTEQVDILF